MRNGPPVGGVTLVDGEALALRDGDALALRDGEALALGLRVADGAVAVGVGEVPPGPVRDRSSA